MKKIEMKKITIILMLVVVFGVSPLLAQTKYMGSWWNLPPQYTVTGDGTRDHPFTITQSERTGKAPRVMSREDFCKAVMGKTPQQLIQTVGRPDGAHDTWWLYSHKVVNPITGKVDDIVIRFENGVVTSFSN